MSIAVGTRPRLSQFRGRNGDADRKPARVKAADDAKTSALRTETSVYPP